MVAARLNCHRTLSAMRASLSVLSFGRSSPFGVASISILRANQCEPLTVAPAAEVELH